MDEENIIQAINDSTIAVQNSKDIKNRIRKHVGGNWLSLPFNNPEVLGSLPEGIESEVSIYYARMKMVIGRINWMVTTSFDDINDVLERQKRTKPELEILKRNLFFMDRQLENISLGKKYLVQKFTYTE